MDKNSKIDKFKGCLTEEIVVNELANCNEIIFEVTEKCNLKCKYCSYSDFYNDYGFRANNLMSFDYAKLLIDYLFSFKKSAANHSSDNKVLIGFYGGEPLLNVSLIKKIVCYVENKTDNAIFSLTTNGLLLKKEINYLVSKDFNILISIDGDYVNNSYRVNKFGKASFSEVYNNIAYVKNHFHTFFKNKIEFHSTLHDKNSVYEVQRFIKKEFNKYPSFGRLNINGVNRKKIDEFNKISEPKKSKNEDVIDVYRIKDLSLVKTVFDDKYHFIRDFSGNFFNQYKDLFLSKSLEEHVIPTGTCLPFGKRIFLTTNGKILPCEKIGHQYKLGEIHDNKIRVNFSEIVKRYNGYYNAISKLCNSCYASDYCQTCLFDCIDGDKINTCQNFMDKKKYDKYVESNLSIFQKQPEIFQNFLDNYTYE